MFIELFYQKQARRDVGEGAQGHVYPFSTEGEYYLRKQVFTDICTIFDATFRPKNNFRLFMQVTIFCIHSFIYGF